LMLEAVPYSSPNILLTRDTCEGGAGHALARDDGGARDAACITNGIVRRGYGEEGRRGREEGGRGMVAKNWGGRKRGKRGG
jgi:hypothetical protein